MLIQLTIPQWLALPIPVRSRLKTVFAVPRSSGTVVEDNQVQSDGHTHNDLTAITVEKMEEFTGEKSDDFFFLFSRVLDKIDAELAAPSAVEEVIVKPVITQELFIQHNGKTYKLIEVPEQPAATVAQNAPLYGGVKVPDATAEISGKEASPKPARTRGKAAGAAKGKSAKTK